MDDKCFFQGCEALWRDVKYAVMARSYSLEQELAKMLRQAQGDRARMHAWIAEMLRVESVPVTEAAMRNTLQHLMGYFKPAWTDEFRREMHEAAFAQPERLRAKLEAALLEEGHPYLLTSYFWRQDTWRTVWFRFRKTWWRMQVLAEDELRVEIMRAGEWLAAQGIAEPLEEWLVQERLGVRLAGQFRAYPFYHEILST